MPDRVQRNEDGSLDEIVASGGAHLEHMGGKRWFLSLLMENGDEVAIWIKGKIEGEELRPGPKAKGGRR